MTKELIKIDNLQVHFPVKGVKKNNGEKLKVKAVDGLTFSIYEGETLGVVGESGCGKTTTGRAILKLVNATGGSIQYKDIDIAKISDKKLRPYRKELQIIFQDPYGCLDPLKTVQEIISRPLVIHKYGTKEEIKKRVIELAEMVGIREDYLDRYPHEFSGGQRQRIGIARAIALNPEFIVCDEPVSALDVSIQAQVINLLKELQGKMNLTLFFISHDLRVVRHICDRVAVMYLGKIIEIAKKEDLYNNPMHPYTQALLSAIPVVNEKKASKIRVKLEGDIPSPLDVPKGCRFNTRCSQCMDICKEQEPEIKEIEEGHFVQCHLVK